MRPSEPEGHAVGTESEVDYERSGRGGGPRSPQILILNDGSGELAAIAKAVEVHGFRATPLRSGIEANSVLRRTRPDLVVLAPSPGPDDPDGCGGLAEFRAVARELGIPLLDVVEPGAQFVSRLPCVEESDDWITRDRVGTELGVRIARLLARRPLDVPSSASNPVSRHKVNATASRTTAPIETWFSSILVHDLRTPLNVIGLSLRMIEQSIPRDDPELEEDLRFIDENFRQLERMLTLVSDYARLFEASLTLSASPFDPRRLVDDLLEDRRSRPGGRMPLVHLDVDRSCPPEVTLDQGRVRLALDNALRNALAAAQDEPVHLTLRGEGARWLIELAIDRPPPQSVVSIDLQPRLVERITASAAERRALELAIVARVSELFGGSSRLVAVAGKKTTIVVDWPARMAVAETAPSPS